MPTCVPLTLNLLLDSSTTPQVLGDSKLVLLSLSTVGLLTLSTYDINAAISSVNINNKISRLAL